MRLIPALRRPAAADLDRGVRPRSWRAVLAVGRAGRSGFDFLAYHAAAVRVLDGQPAYDTSFHGAGGFGLFYYPPTFIPLVLPFGLLRRDDRDLAVDRAARSRRSRSASWCCRCRGRTKWLLVLLAGLSWPFLYALKLGQVGPILFALFAVGWAGMSTPSGARRHRRPRGGDQDPARARSSSGRC